MTVSARTPAGCDRRWCRAPRRTGGRRRRSGRPPGVGHGHRRGDARRLRSTSAWTSAHAAATSRSAGRATSPRWAPTRRHPLDPAERAPSGRGAGRAGTRRRPCRPARAAPAPPRSRRPRGHGRTAAPRDGWTTACSSAARCAGRCSTEVEAPPPRVDVTAAAAVSACARTAPAGPGQASAGRRGPRATRWPPGRRAGGTTPGTSGADSPVRSVGPPTAPAPPRPGCAYTGTPAAASASRSRRAVGTDTSSTAAASVAVTRPRDCSRRSRLTSRSARMPDPAPTCSQVSTMPPTGWKAPDQPRKDDMLQGMATVSSTPRTSTRPRSGTPRCSALAAVLRRRPAPGGFRVGPDEDEHGIIDAATPRPGGPAPRAARCCTGSSTTPRPRSTAWWRGATERQPRDAARAGASSPPRSSTRSATCWPS